MDKVLPQQELLLELLTVSGDIAVPGPPDESLLWRTLRECQQARWLALSEISPGIFKVRITASGRLARRSPGASPDPAARQGAPED